MKNVTVTKNRGLCCSCGICAGACPKNAIHYVRSRGMFLPVIDKASCIDCGICLQCCPGLQISYQTNGNDTPLQEAVRGPVLETYVTWSKDAQLRHLGASGGTVMTIIRELLRRGSYDGAFCVTSYHYGQQAESELIGSFAIDETCSKSRYVPISHEKAVRYIRQNPEKRLILVGTPCAISGLCKVIDHFRLDREKYLLIGLFCERLFQYNIFDYFSALPQCKGKELVQLHFKNKESGGWPGNPKLIFADGSFLYLDASHRTEMKDYFQPERCLYCIDKLNVFADISCGDNYTCRNDSPLGSNSTIVRTQRGIRAFQMAQELLEIRTSSIEAIEDAQVTDIRSLNCLREKAVRNQVNRGILADLQSPPPDNTILERLQLGACFLENPKALISYRSRHKQREAFQNAIRRPYRLVKKILRRIKPNE